MQYIVQILSNYSCDDETVISLAMTYSWVTACSVAVAPPNGEGEKQNTWFKEVFRTLLPKSLSAIVQKNYSVLESLEPEERILQTLDTVPVSNAEPTSRHVALTAAKRVYADILYIPTDRAQLVYVRRETLHQHICHGVVLANTWIPTVPPSSLRVISSVTMESF